MCVLITKTFHCLTWESHQLHLSLAMTTERAIGSCHCHSRGQEQACKKSFTFELSQPPAKQPLSAWHLEEFGTPEAIGRGMWRLVSMQMALSAVVRTSTP